MPSLFTIGETYHRRDIFRILNVPPDKQAGDWLTGLHEHDGDFFIMCNVGSAGRTGHNYGNVFIGDELSWSGKTGSTRHQPRYARLLSGDAKVFVFYRENDRHPFRFAGFGKPVEIEDIVPVRIRWSFASSTENPLVLAQELDPSRTYNEGAVKRILVNVYERNPIARQECVDYYGAVCQVCDFNFFEAYGDLGRGFIHVHHLLSLSDIGAEYEVDPVKDLSPVCPNCHAMLHRKVPPYTVSELRAIVRAQLAARGHDMR